MGKYTARGGFSGGMSGAQKQQMQMQKIMELQRQMEEKQKEIEAREFTATAGGGVVSATVSGKKELTKLSIQPDAVDPEDVEMLEDLVLSAVNEALRQADSTMSSAMNAFTSGLGL
ncbi:MAG: YbaB/EbfC family nucleoid-associated protein [Oscillospiraceae bacterium]